MTQSKATADGESCLSDVNFERLSSVFHARAAKPSCARLPSVPASLVRPMPWLDLPRINGIMVITITSTSFLVSLSPLCLELRGCLPELLLLLLSHFSSASQCWRERDDAKIDRQLALPRPPAMA